MSDLKPMPYQVRAATRAANALFADNDVLLVAPTGSGKTAMMARTARALTSRGRRVMVLTHRKTLFRQIAGDPAADDLRKKRGEMVAWGNDRVGRVADPALGGVSQDPPLVIGMVETVAARLDAIRPPDVVMIDETHHASRESAERSQAGAYARILEAFPDARVMGVTATPFRGDEDRLHPRLEAARQIAVSVSEARTGGRVVPVRTIEGRAPLEDGTVPGDRARAAQRDPGLGPASAHVRHTRGEAYYDRGIRDWERIVGRRPTLAFADSIAEVEHIAARFDAAYGPGTAAPLHGKRRHEENAAALAAYESGRLPVLVSCQMIGEGFDVPATDAVMSFNASLSRTEMIQIAGRAARTAAGKKEGVFLDYGTATATHGRVEDQYGLHDVAALATTRDAVSSARVVGRAAPEQRGSWRVAPGGEQSLFLRNVSAGTEVWRLTHRAERDAGRRAGRSGSSVDRFELASDLGKNGVVGVVETGRILAEHVGASADAIARMGGLEGDAYRARGRALLERWGGHLERISGQDLSPSGKSRDPSPLGQAVLETLATGGSQSAAVRRHLAALPPEEALPSALALSCMVVGACSEDASAPLGVRAQSRGVAERLGHVAFDRIKPERLAREAESMTAFLGEMSHGPVAGGIRRAGKDLATAMRDARRAMSSQRRRAASDRGESQASAG